MESGREEESGSQVSNSLPQAYESPGVSLQIDPLLVIHRLCAVGGKRFPHEHTAVGIFFSVTPLPHHLRVNPSPGGCGREEERL